MRSGLSEFWLEFMGTGNQTESQDLCLDESLFTFHSSSEARKISVWFMGLDS